MQVSTVCHLSAIMPAIMPLRIPSLFLRLAAKRKVEAQWSH
ncbi:MAG: hypothetical protein ACI3Y0_13075 [Prevotella sp.]